MRNSHYKFGLTHISYALKHSKSRHRDPQIPTGPQLRAKFACYLYMLTRNLPQVAPDSTNRVHNIVRKPIHQANSGHSDALYAFKSRGFGGEVGLGVVRNLALFESSFS